MTERELREKWKSNLRKFEKGLISEDAYLKIRFMLERIVVR